MNVHDGLDDTRWIRGLGGEKLPAASYALLPNPEKGLFFAIREGSTVLSPVFYTAAPKCVCIRRRAGARPRITVCFVDTVARGWVGAPNERAQLIFRGALVGFVD